jgi:two-component system alkaline phosphatase synthesis response regulator PhoP
LSKEEKVILIVDDEPDILNLTEKFLKLGNFQTITCNNGKEAMKIIEERHDEIALILLDIMMPGKSGYSVLEEIKNNDNYKDIIVVLFTVKSFNEDLQKGKKLGADGYLTKPFSGKELLKYVKEIIKKNN